jgi:hypothetical protein
MTSVFKSKKKLMWLIGVVLVLLIGAYAAYQKISQPKAVVLDVAFYNYTDRPIFDETLGGRIELNAGPPFGQGTGIMTFTEIPFGPQTLTWRDAGTGETFTAKNKLEITPEDIPEGTEFVTFHLYPDETVEAVFSKEYPKRTARGETIFEEAEKKGAFNK